MRLFKFPFIDKDPDSILSGEMRPAHMGEYRIKLYVIAGGVSLLFLIILGRLFYLQVLSQKYFESLALGNKQQTIIVPAHRGEIYVDGGKTRIVKNETSFSIYVVPNNFPKEPERSLLVDQLGAIFGMDTNRLVTALKAGRWNPYRSRIVMDDVPISKIYYLAEHLDDFPGLNYQYSPKRVYSNGLMWSHIVGYIRGISSAEYGEKSHQGYNRNSLVGKKGIEAQYDLELRGQDGYKIQTVDARNRVKGEVQPEGGEPVPGNDIILTIDEKIQKSVYDMMQGYPGGAVVTKASTGEILALYSYPSYDPNIFIGEVEKEIYDKYANDPQLPFFNRVIQGEYPPSSVFKIIVSAAALADDEVNFYRDIQYCAGGIAIGPQFFKCEGWHNAQNMFAGFADSCNVYYYRVGIKIGSEKIIRFAHDYFGLGKATGIDLPYERKGRVPSHRWKSEMKGTFWWDGDTANLSIGQGFLLATVMQMNTVTAAIANNGVAYQPHLLKSVRSATDGREIYAAKKNIQVELPLDKEKIELIQRAMRAVVEWGTAERAAGHSRVPIAGKTGTAQNIQGNAHAWFSCYAPYQSQDPDKVVVVTVFIENGGHGGAAAAPFATSILESIYLGNDVRYNFKRIMQGWESRRTQYEEWLQKRNEGFLPKTQEQIDAKKENDNTSD